MADSSASRINVSALKRVDPYLCDIIDSATHVALYKFKTDTNEWEKTDIEGALFVYSRTGPPHHGVLIMNRLSTNNLVEPVTKELDLQENEPFLLYKNSRGIIFGIWFYDATECVKVSKLLQRMVKEIYGSQALSKTTPKKEVDIFSMLSRAQEDYNMNKVTGKSPSVGESQPRPPENFDGSTSQSVMDFFAKAKGQQKDIHPPGINAGMFQAPSRGRAAVQIPVETGDAQIKPFLQRLMSNPVHSVEHIEKQQRSITPQEPKQQALITPKQKPFNIQHSTPKQNNEPSPSARANVKNSFHPIAGPSTSATNTIQEATFYNSKLEDSSLKLEDSFAKLTARSDVSVAESETPKKPALMLPSMFTSATKDKNNGSVVRPTEVTREQPERPEPLTRNQLYQAFNYLLKNDPEFVNKLHEAYVKSFSEMIT